PIPIVDEKMAATMVGLVVRFVPVILFQAVEISDAQRARCVERRKNPLIRLMRFATPLLRRVFGSADELAVAMQARCFNEQRTLPDLRFSRRDGLALGIGVIMALSVFLP
ncbi:MAG: energy-coupling factor transporter transmembrane component T, partial [Desulfosarcina sp.]